MKALLALLALPLALAASSHRKLVDLATAGKGIITLDAATYDLITAPNRNWSVAIQLTALDPKRRCAPCKEFDSTWKAVATAWASVPEEYRGDHFFASLDFDHGHTVFQKVKSVSPTLYRRLTQDQSAWADVGPRGLCASPCTRSSRTSRWKDCSVEI